LAGEEIEADRGERAAAHDGGFGAPFIEDPAAELGHDHEPEEEVEDVDARAGRALPERHLGIDAREEEERYEHDRHQR
jgi:hypothetical protein